MMEGNESGIAKTSPSDITFIIEGSNIMKLCQNGDIFIKGHLVKNDLEVVEGMREFLVKSGAIKSKGEQNNANTK